ncbi:MAG: apolipoprotein N-acyltransferase [Pseudomonadota bacterium]
MADILVLLHGWRRTVTAFLAGAASALAMPPFFVAPILLVTLSTLVLLLDAADADPKPTHRRLVRPGPFFFVGWWFGFGYFLAGLYWIAEALLVNAAAHGWLIPLALVFIPGGLAVFMAFGCMVAGWMWGTGMARVGVLAVWLTVFEYLRGILFTGFPWNSFNHALGVHEALIQGHALVGPHGAGFLVLLVAMLPAALWPRAIVGRGSRIATALVATIFVGWAGYGAARLNLATHEVVEGVQLRIVQPNIPQDEKWDPDLRDRNFARLLELTSQRTGQGQLGALGATHIIWPESAFPFLINQRPDALSALSTTLPLGTNLIAGAIRSEPRGNGERVFRNSIYAFNDRAEIVDAYDKVRLVPFGEQIPFAAFLNRIGIIPLVSAPAGFIRGPGAGTLTTATALPSATLTGLGLVCYEAIFPAFVRQGVLELEPDYLINVTNDAWFGTSIGPHQHVFQARLRSVETGKPMVRAANTGISTVMDGYGRTLSQIDLGNRGVLDTSLPRALEATPYLRFGDLPIQVLLVMVLGISVYHLRKQI